MIKKIMVAYDGGDQAQLALDNAISMSKCMGAEIYLVTIFNPFSIFHSFESSDPNFVNEAMAKDRKELDDMISQAVKKAEDQGIKVKVQVIEDKPGLARIGPTLVNYAEANNIDIMVMGRRTKSGLSRLVLGSVSNYVIQAAHCSVMFVKD
ncbi:MAG: universal stress protein [Syntrophomonadaceae bacterium]|jgi:nucleotide-binding universal stress UspA family protein|nr:universal stress protein [Syntrophomonadaceae bacterium]